MSIGNGRLSDFYLDIVRGVYPDKEPVIAYGSITTAGAGDGILWADGAFNVNPTADRSIEIVSTSASDAAGGTGVRSLEVHYLDSNYLPQAETVLLNGLTPVVMVATNIRFIQYAHAVTVGSNKKSVGNISLRIAGAGDIYNYIPIGETATTSSFRMVPAGKRLIIVGAIAGSTSGAANTQVELAIVGTESYTHQFINPPIFFDYIEIALQDASISIPFPIPLKLSETMIAAIKYEVDKASLITATWFGFFENA